MKRWACLVTLLAVTSPAHAQQQSPPPSIGLPLPPIGLPLPVIGLQPLPDPLTTTAPFHTGARPKPHVKPQPAIVFFGAPYDFGYEEWQLSPTPGVIAQPPASAETPREALDSGWLELLNLKPADAQLFVDGEYVGSWNDHGGVLELSAGTHEIEIKAPGFETLAFDVRIAPGRTITYRGALTRLSGPPRAPGNTRPQASDAIAPSDVKKPSAPVSQTFYLIPGCYLGNVPPEEVKLPEGCDRSRVITHKPH